MLFQGCRNKVSMIKLSTSSGRGLGLALLLFHPFQPNSADTGTDLKSETGRWGKNNELFCTRKLFSVLKKVREVEWWGRKREESLREGILCTGGSAPRRNKKLIPPPWQITSTFRLKTPNRKSFRAPLRAAEQGISQSLFRKALGHTRL